MRTEKEMLDLIINTAKEDERIRAVLMEGSRADKNALKDIFQDYDIVYVVNDVAPFYNNTEYIKRFGELLMLQMPETMRGPANDGHFGYLMQFADGNRIDLTFDTAENCEDKKDDTPLIVLLDKDGIFRQEDYNTDDRNFHVKPPNENDYFSSCNDFWWLCGMNIAKGIWRDELPIVMYMMNTWMRNELHYMIDYYIGIKNDFKVSAGKCGKYYKNFLSERHYNMYKATYSDAEYENIWKAVFTAGELFRELAIEVGEHFNYDYLHEDDRKVTAFMKHIKNLPKDAKEIY